MFVCLGNICRSPMAEFIFKDLVNKNGLSHRFEIASSATSTEEAGNDIHYGAKRKLREKGIPFTYHTATKFTVADYDYYDYVIVMEQSNIRGLLRIIGEDKDNKITRLKDFCDGGDIADPWYTGNFDDTYSDIMAGCTALLKYFKDRSVI